MKCLHADTVVKVNSMYAFFFFFFHFNLLVVYKVIQQDLNYIP